MRAIGNWWHISRAFMLFATALGFTLASVSAGEPPAAGTAAAAPHAAAMPEGVLLTAFKATGTIEPEEVVEVGAEQDGAGGRRAAGRAIPPRGRDHSQAGAVVGPENGYDNFAKHCCI